MKLLKTYNYKKLIEAQIIQEEMPDVKEQQENIQPDFPIEENQQAEPEENIITLTEDEVFNNNFLADNNDDKIQENFVDTPTDAQLPSLEKAVEDIEDVPVDKLNNNMDRIKWAVDNKRVVQISYTTLHGKTLNRVIEPHLIFKAKTTPNTIVVTYDRSVAAGASLSRRNAIRNFIIDRISSINFGEKKFKNRIKIIPSKEMIAMDINIFTKLSNIGNELEKSGLTKSAEVVTDVMKNLIQIKEAQYVGVQGYWIRNSRCWSNCYRHKRTAKPKLAAQEVFTECWEEYLKAIEQNDTKDWDKYASEYANIKVASNSKAISEDFIKTVKNHVKLGGSLPEAVYSKINEEIEKSSEKIIENSDTLLSLAETLTENGQKELSKKIANLSVELLKEADFNERGWIGKAWDWLRGRKPGGKRDIDLVIQHLNAMLKRINTMLTKLQRQKPLSQPAQTTAAQTQSIKISQKISSLQNEFRQFTKDLAEEVGVLYSIWKKNNDQSIGNIALNLNNALNQVDNYLNSGTPLSNQQMAEILNNLRNNVTNAMFGVQQIENQPEPQNVQEQNVTPPETNQENDTAAALRWLKQLPKTTHGMTVPQLIQMLSK